MAIISWQTGAEPAHALDSVAKVGDLLTVAELVQRLGVGRTTLDAAKKEAGIQPFKRRGKRALLYDVDEIQAALDNDTRRIAARTRAQAGDGAVSRGRSRHRSLPRPPAQAP